MIYLKSKSYFLWFFSRLFTFWSLFGTKKTTFVYLTNVVFFE